MKPKTVLIVLLLLFMVQIELSVGQQESLVVRVFDLEGRPRPGIELSLSNSTFRRLFETTAQGIAEFRLISPGTYNISATVDGVVVASTTVNYPSVTRLNLTLKIQNIELVVTDLDEKPVEGLTIELRSEQGPIIRRGVTDSSGRIFVRDVPFSNLSQVGPYRVSGSLQTVTVLNSTISVFPETKEYRLSAEIVRIGINVLNFGGRPVNATVRVNAEHLNFSTSVTPGSVASVPSSRLAGTYGVEIVKTYQPQRPEITLLRETVIMDRSQNFTYVLDVSDLTVRVRDEEGRNIRGVKLILESERLGELVSGVTGPRGEITFDAVPFSEGRPGAGLYKIVAYRDGYQIGLLETRHLPDENIFTLTISKVNTRFLITRPNGAPLPNATITLIDQAALITYSTTSDLEGMATLRLIPGPHNYAVSYMGVEVSQGILNASETILNIRVAQVDIEFRVKVLDWLGNTVRGAGVSIVWRSQELQSARQEDGSLVTLVPVKGVVGVDVYLDGVLMERRTVFVSSPTLYEVRLRGVFFGDRLLDLETVSSIVAGAVLALFAGSAVYLWRKRPIKS